ncbi:DUF4175 domain-containing protein [Aquisalimonas sp. 2447]|uniref:DUF4175 domain-containing protein n=1 Tax=Aquisalimonas sp. 2447 TaxID=2740807 RepID=UPI0014324102|nr:DUF4175 domain-containing protein [Aquisalimonas sp. 2447]QIT55950.1 DUF4175 domain-containing protein [Aquisalimonas sp. 2447]
MRLLIAVAVSAVIVGLYVFLLYAFATWIWPVLPDWAMLIAFVLIAVFLVGSPIMALRHYGQVRSAARKARGDDEDKA